jgi:hypothetical protein
MTRPTLEVADILRAQGDRFLDRYRSSFDFQQLKAFRAIQRCRTAALGGHRDACPSCGYQAISYNSCRNRHCPKCQAQARERELLDASYFHVVFTVPHELNVLVLNPRLFYDLLFTASAQTLLEIASDPKHLGAEVGLIGILHTWGQNLLLHPHIHCVVPGGGFSPDHRRWIRPRYPFFLRFLENLTDARLSMRVSYDNLQGVRWEYSLAEMMQHLVHSSYHQGQVAVLAWQIGAFAESFQDEELRFSLPFVGGAELAHIREAPSPSRWVDSEEPAIPRSLPLGVLRFCLLKDRHIRVSVLPEGKEILVDRR